MATRMIATGLWTDKEFRRIKSIKTRYLWIYLLSCPMSKVCGVFHLPLDIVAFDTKLSEEDIDKGLQELEINNFVYYARETEEIVIYNYPKYNITNMGKPMIDCITRELELVSDRTLVARIVDSLKDYQKTLGNEHKKESVESIIETYSDYLPNKEKVEVDDLKDINEIIGKKEEKTIIKERVIKNSNTTTNTTTNSDSIHDSVADSYTDSSKQDKKIEKVDWCSKNQDELF